MRRTSLSALTGFLLNKTKLENVLPKHTCAVEPQMDIQTMGPHQRQSEDLRKKKMHHLLKQTQGSVPFVNIIQYTGLHCILLNTDLFLYS